MGDSKRVMIYSAAWCAFCHMAKNYLNSLGVTYKELDVDKVPSAAQELIQKTGQVGIPVIEIGDSTIIGFDKPRIDQALKENKLV